MILCQIQTSLILKKVSLSASMSNTENFNSKKVSLSVSLSNIDIFNPQMLLDIFNSQKGEFECFYVKYRHL